MLPLNFTSNTTFRMKQSAEKHKSLKTTKVENKRDNTTETDKIYDEPENAAVM